MLEFCTNLGPIFWRAYVLKYWFWNWYRFEISAKIRWFWYWYRNPYWNGSKCNFVFSIGFEIQLSQYWYRYWFRNKCLPARNIDIKTKWTVLHSPAVNVITENHAPRFQVGVFLKGECVISIHKGFSTGGIPPPPWFTVHVITVTTQDYWLADQKKGKKSVEHFKSKVFLLTFCVLFCCTINVPTLSVLVTISIGAA